VYEIKYARSRALPHSCGYGGEVQRLDRREGPEMMTLEGLRRELEALNTQEDLFDLPPTVPLSSIRQLQRLRKW
jgi:hypothetical protein